MVGREGVAAAALTLRWGSYLAVLLDHDKPVWPEVDSPSTSRISDEEMARINIEASAALAEWIDIYRDRPGWAALRAAREPGRRLPPDAEEDVEAQGHRGRRPRAARDGGAPGRGVPAPPTPRLARVRGDVERHPSRVLANALVNTAWRNGPVEDIHAGELRGLPLDQRRVTPAEERELMAFASERLALGMTVCLQFSMERPAAPLGRAGAALRLGRDAADYAVEVDAYRGLARGTPPGGYVSTDSMRMSFSAPASASS